MYYLKKALQSTNQLKHKITYKLPSISTLKQNFNINNVEGIPEHHRLLASIIKCKHQMQPIKDMNKLAELSYDSQSFSEIYQSIETTLLSFQNNITGFIEQLQYKECKQLLNLLCLIAYLIKYGVSAFIDEFRHNLYIFKIMHGLNSNIQNEFVKNYVNSIKDKAAYIVALLTDDNIILKEKQLAMLVRSKLWLSGNYSNSSLNQQQNERVQSFLDHYLWRYILIFDSKIEAVVQAIGKKIDTYILGEVPDGFQIESVHQIEQRIRSEVDFSLIKAKETKYVEQKHGISKEKKDDNGPQIDSELI